MALNGLLKLVGDVQGQIKGSVTQKGREGMIKVMAAEQQIGANFDVATLQITGKRVLAPFTIIKEVDLATIGLRRALATNEQFKEWELRLWRVSTVGAGAGVEKHFFTIKLSDARVQQIRFVLPDTRDPSLVSRLEFEHIVFLYKKISWTWIETGATHEDTIGAGTGPTVRRRR